MDKSKKFDEIFHHTQNLSLYDDMQSASFQVGPTEHSYEVMTDLTKLLETDGRMTAMAYGQMITPKSYDGKSNSRIWINHYEAIAEVNIWDNDMKMRRVVGSLDGAAFSWYLNQRLIGTTHTWTTFKEALINRFTNSFDDYMLTENIVRTKQKSNDFDSYWEQKMGLIRLTSPKMNQKELMHHMFDGLTKDLRNKVMEILPFRKCETAEELKILIREIQDIVNYKKAESGSNPMRNKRYPSGGYVKEGDFAKDEKIKNLSSQVRQLKKELAELTKTVDEKQEWRDPAVEEEAEKDCAEVDEEEMECLECGEVVHPFWECPNKNESDGEVVPEVDDSE